MTFFTKVTWLATLIVISMKNLEILVSEVHSVYHTTFNYFATYFIQMCCFVQCNLTQFKPAENSARETYHTLHILTVWVWLGNGIDGICQMMWYLSVIFAEMGGGKLYKRVYAYIFIQLSHSELIFYSFRIPENYSIIFFNSF